MKYNNKCRAFTSLEQSHKLAEILPLDSADCFWDYDDMQKFHRISWFEDGYNKESQLRLNENNVCAWSLAALLEVLPNKIISHETAFEDEDAEDINYTYYKYLKVTEDDRYMCYYKEIDIKYDCYADNPIDACYELILKLHEHNLL